jgi:hypothetical protein
LGTPGLDKTGAGRLTVRTQVTSGSPTVRYLQGRADVLGADIVSDMLQRLQEHDDLLALIMAAVFGESDGEAFDPVRDGPVNLEAADRFDTDTPHPLLYRADGAVDR